MKNPSQKPHKPYKLNSDNVRPLTLYVTSVEINPSLQGLLIPAVRAIDTELDKEAARKIRDALNDYLDNVTIGTIRIRHIGRMVQ